MHTSLDAVGSFPKFRGSPTGMGLAPHAPSIRVALLAFVTLMIVDVIELRTCYVLLADEKRYYG